MTYYRNFTTGFGLGDVTFYIRSMSISVPYFVDNSIHGWDITVFVFEKQTCAILELYFQFWFRLYDRSRHQSAEFRPNRSTLREKITSYPFLKMAAPAPLNTTSPLLSIDITVFRRSISRPNYVNISIHGWDITTSVFQKKTNVRHIRILLPVSISTISP